MIGVLLVDDHRLVLAGLAGLVDQAEDLRVVGLASDGAQALEVAEQVHPDVVLMDLSMPVMDGIATTRKLLELQPDVRVLVLTSFSDRDRILEAVRAGAVGYLLKDSDPQDLVRGIRAAARGESPLDPRVAGVVLREGGARTVGPAPVTPAPVTPAPVVPAPVTPADPAQDLTAREREVLLLVREGLANKQIASRLGITLSTVKAHLSSAFVRIGVTDRTSAALWAQRHLIDGPSSAGHAGHPD